MVIAAMKLKDTYSGWEDALEKGMASTPVLLPGKFHGWRSLVGYSPWGGKESDKTEQLHFTSLHFTPWKESYDQPRQHIKKQDAWDKHSGLIHWNNPEGWDGEGGGSRVQDGEHM